FPRQPVARRQREVRYAVSSRLTARAEELSRRVRRVEQRVAAANEGVRLGSRRQRPPLEEGRQPVRQCRCRRQDVQLRRRLEEGKNQRGGLFEGVLLIRRAVCADDSASSRRTQEVLVTRRSGAIVRGTKKGSPSGLPFLCRL